MLVRFGTRVRVSHNTEAEEILRRERVTSRFEGAAIDTGAQRSVINLQRAYAQMVGPRVNLLPCGGLIRFGDVVCSSLGSMTADIPCPTGMLRVSVDVVSLDIPLLLGLDLMDDSGCNFYQCPMCWST
jgi:hypothetical protein